MKIGNQRLLHDINISLILQTVQEQAPISRTDIVQQTGLAASTVSTLIGELQSNGLIRECGRASSSGGRRPVLLEVNPDGGHFIGVDLSGAKISLGVLDLSAKLVKEWQYAMPQDGGEELYSELVNAIREVKNWCSKQGVSVLGIGVSTPGLIDSTNGLVIEANNLCWHQFNLGERLKEEFGCLCVIENDTNAAAYGEFLYAAALSLSHVLKAINIQDVYG